MKKTIIISILLLIAIILGISTKVITVAKFNLINIFTQRILSSHYLNWYESRAKNEIEDGNIYALERLEKKYHVFVNGILIDIGYDWDGTIYVPIRTVSESLNWLVNWIPELGVIQLVKADEEAYVDIVNFFGKAYVDLTRLENILRLQEVAVHGGNIGIYNDHTNSFKSISTNKLKKFNLYIDGMKMTTRAVEYDDRKYVPTQAFAMSFSRMFRYDAVQGHAYVDNRQIDSIFVGGEAYSTLDDLKSIINIAEYRFEYTDFLSDKSDLQSVIFEGLKEKTIALTFDDYLGDKVYPLLDVLEKHNVKGTFFIIGNSIEANSEVLKAIVGKGHEIANHTWDHFNIHTLRDDEIRAQLISTQLALKRYGGVKAMCFRPPGGYYDNKVTRIAQDVGLHTVLWSLNSTDADTQNSSKIIKNTILELIHPGAIIVMHMDRESTIEALPDTIEKLRYQGYNFVTVSEMISDMERK